MADGRRSRDGAKGKGKEPQPAQDREGEDSQIPSGSLAGRIANSAAGLAGSMLGGPPSNAALAESLSAEKGQPSAANDRAQRVGESSVQLHREPQSGSFFRESQTQAHIAAEESAFATFLDDADVLQPPEPTNTMDMAWQVHADMPKGSSMPSGSSMPRRSGSARPFSPFTSVYEQQARDGEAVVSLLAGGGDVIFAPDEAEEQVMLPEERDSLRRALFNDGPEATVPSQEWDNLLNFVPEYLRAGTEERYWGDVPSDSTRSTETRAHLGVSDPDQAWELWVGQWSDVLTKYTDEVWGDLGSLVEQARSEVEQLENAKPDDPPPQTKALRRLRAILGHLRGHQDG